MTWQAIPARPELEEMISTMEQFEIEEEDTKLPNLEEFKDGGLGDLCDDFILQVRLMTPPHIVLSCLVTCQYRVLSFQVI